MSSKNDMVLAAETDQCGPPAPNVEAETKSSSSSSDDIPTPADTTDDNNDEPNTQPAAKKAKIVVVDGEDPDIDEPSYLDLIRDYAEKMPPGQERTNLGRFLCDQGYDELDDPQESNTMSSGAVDSASSHDGGDCNDNEGVNEQPLTTETTTTTTTTKGLETTATINGAKSDNHKDGSNGNVDGGNDVEDAASTTKTKTILTATTAEDAGTKWFKKFELLKEYKENHGNCLVPHDYDLLGSWVNAQRYFYRRFKEGKKTYISQKRIDLLDEIQFVWDSKAVRNKNKPKKAAAGTAWERKWMKNFELLKEYKSRHGNLFVGKEQGDLHRWVIAQQQYYRMRNEDSDRTPRITQGRIDLLNSIGFMWSFNLRTRVDWHVMFEELKLYKCEHGHCNVTKFSIKSSPKLAMWVHNQRNLYRIYKSGKSASITEERIALLEGIGFEWKTRIKKSDEQK